ncbi:DUF1800 domain-containing protein [Pelagicoccus mobilis]|uniref:DUF1800 domain-containing protein n=1 Tax=Pelagicoccus mobilis TaxID=415221 RepID=A0A934VMI4_9BACT|nr:DUF1800 family protein [Pelagicoccus mobilis]MBK1878886.1 DUF1800 domain-containing protein [Pelagicoccus mobilis]
MPTAFSDLAFTITQKAERRLIITPQNMPKTELLRRAMLCVTLSLATFASAAHHELPLPTNFPDWLADIPGAPESDDPDQDGATSFYEYALGAEPADALDASKSGHSPYLTSEDGSALLRFDFDGRQDVVYIFETRTDLAPDDWSVLAWKLGPTPWQVVTDGATLTQDGAYLSFNYPDAREQLYRLRVETHDSLLNEAQAVRFLRQATFGPRREDIEELLHHGLDFEEWVEDQIALPATTHTELAKTIPAFANYPASYPFGGANGNAHSKGMVWFEAAINAPDQLRQRMAWALFQIIVVGESGSANTAYLDEWLHYYDFYVTHATGNYRDLLQDVTESPKMGRYLTYVNNQKANNSGTRQPDENYAREVMQLFTIGLWELNRDGTLKLDENEQPIPTYDNTDITELAKVFTGFQYAADNPNYQDTDQNWIDPMRRNENRHDRGEKTLVDGTVLPANQNTITDVTQALDVLFNHPNTAPFISKRLIQRITCSNPSPQYVDRVAAAFEDDGNGERGNLAAVAKAILLDPEARSGRFIVDPTRGKLREPLNRFLQYCRSFELSTTRSDKLLYIRSLETYFGQFPYRSPTVFNFYLPDFSPSGEVRDENLVAPEFQILDDSTGIRTFQIMESLVKNGLAWPIGGNGHQGSLDFSHQETLASDATALVDHLNLLLANNALNETEKTAIITAVEALPEGDTEARTERALTLFSIAPGFNILK